MHRHQGSSAAETTWSEWLQQPDKAWDILQGHRELRVHQPDGDDLVVTTASEAAQASEVSSAATCMFVALMQRDPRAREWVIRVLPTTFPWVRYLPTEDLRAFVLELVEALERADSKDNPAPVAQALAAWRATAESYADPEYIAAQMSVGHDLGPVAPPRES